MAISATALTVGSDGTTGETATTASITPSANALQLLHVHAHPSGGPGYATVTGCGLTWVEIHQQNYDVPNGDTQQLFRAMGSSPSTGSLTLDFGTAPGDNQLEIMWSLVEFTGVDTSGTNGSGAIVQAVENVGTSTTPNATLSAFGSADNATYGAAACGSGGFPLAVGSGFTELHNAQGPTVGLLTLTEWKTANDTTVDASCVSTVWGMIAVEIKAADTGPPPRIIAPIQSVSF